MAVSPSSAGGEDRVGLGADERHQAHLAEACKGGGGGRVQGLLQDLLTGTPVRSSPSCSEFRETSV